MKQLLIILFFSNSVWTQINCHNSILPSNLGELDELLQGSWILTSTSFSEDYFLDTSSFKLNEKRIHHIDFQNEIVTVFPDTVERYYIGPTTTFEYSLKYDTLFNEHQLDLFYGKKRKTKFKRSTYKIIELNRDKLVLESFHYVNRGLDRISYALRYTYRREGVEELITQLNGVWNNCSDSANYFGIKILDTDEITFSKVASSQCEDNAVQTTIDFHLDDQNQSCLVSSWKQFIGGAFIGCVEVDPGQMELYFSGLSYKILLITEDQLVLKPINNPK